MAVARRELDVIVCSIVLCLIIVKIPTVCLSSQLNSDEKVALFVFGDSLFDPGNNNYINTTTDFQVNYWPYGQSYFDTPTGRFSDGRLISDFIAEYAGLPLIPAYLEPGNNEFTYGANFASGGAGALVDSNAGFVVDLQTQLRYFGDLETIYRRNLGDSKSQKLLYNAVYLISCGGNDYYNFLSQYSYEQYVEMVIGNMTYVIKTLKFGDFAEQGIYEKGGRKFGIMTSPVVGCWPGIRLQQPGNTCRKDIDDVTILHNQALARKLQDLEEELEGFMYAKFDFATSLLNRIKNPTKYGFKEGDTACCGSGLFRGLESCGGMRGIKEYELCDNATEYLFFDAYHPSELASRQLAELFWNGDSKVTEPYTLKTLFEVKPSTTFIPDDEL